MDTLSLYHPRLVLAEDHADTAELLRALLEPEFDVLAVVQDGSALVRAAERLSPDVIVSDITMPGLDGIAAASAIRRRDGSARIVFVSMHADQVLVDRGLATGALGYVAKISAGDELAPAIRAALRGEHYVSHGLQCPKDGAGCQSDRKGSDER